MEEEKQGYLCLFQQRRLWLRCQECPQPEKTYFRLMKNEKGGLSLIIGDCPLFSIWEGDGFP